MKFTLLLPCTNCKESLEEGRKAKYCLRRECYLNRSRKRYGNKIDASDQKRKGMK